MLCTKMAVLAVFVSAFSGAAALGKGVPKPPTFSDVLAVIGKAPLALEDDHAAHLIPKRRFLLSATVVRARRAGAAGSAKNKRAVFFQALVYHRHGRMIIFEKFGGRKLAYYARDRKRRALLVGVDLNKPERLLASRRGALMLLMLSKLGTFGLGGGYNNYPKLQVDDGAFLSLNWLKNAETVCFSRAKSTLFSRCKSGRNTKTVTLHFTGGPSLYLLGVNGVKYVETSPTGRFVLSIVVSLKEGHGAPRLPLHLTAKGLRKLGFIKQPHGGTALSRFVLHKLKAAPSNAGKPTWRGAKARQFAAKFTRWATKPHRPTRHPQRKWKHPMRPRVRLTHPSQK